MAVKSLQQLLEEVDRKKAELDSYRPLPGYLLKELNEWFKVELTYSSTALEGNTLTRIETATILEKDLPTEGKSVKEHLLAVGHATAFEYILDLAQCSRCDLTLQDILYIHYLIFDNIDKAYDGVHKGVELELSTKVGPYRPQLKYIEAMEKLLKWLHQVDAHPILIAAEAHSKLLALQPFNEGNGITARLLMNLLLLQKGYEPVIIWPEDGLEYVRLIGEAIKSNNLEPLYSFITKRAIDSFDLYLSKVKPAL